MLTDQLNNFTIILATAIREALNSLERDSNDTTMDKINVQGKLIMIVNEGDRTQSAKAACSDGLIFVGARFAND